MRAVRKVVGRSVDRGTCGPGIEPRKLLFVRGADVARIRRKATAGVSAIARADRTPRGLRPRARTQAPHEGGEASRSEAGRSLAGSGRSAASPRREPAKGTTAMNEPGKSDKPVVPAKPANASASMSFWELSRLGERMKGRGLAKDNGEGPRPPPQPVQQNRSMGHRAP